MLVKKRLLSGVVGVATALVLGGCATNQELPVDKVVLDWKDFYPTNFSLLDNCNTYKADLKDTQYQKKLCFEDRSSLPGERYYLNVQITQYDQYSGTWNQLLSVLSEPKTRLASELLYQQSKTVCKSGYETVGANGFRCTPAKYTGDDILVISNYQFTKYGKLVETTVASSISTDKFIDESSSPYKTALTITNEALQKFSN